MFSPDTILSSDFKEESLSTDDAKNILLEIQRFKKSLEEDLKTLRALREFVLLEFM